MQRSAGRAEWPPSHDSTAASRMASLCTPVCPQNNKYTWLDLLTSLLLHARTHTYMHREREKMYANHFEHVNNRKSTMLTIVSGITNILFLSTLERPSPEFWWKTIDLLGRVKSKM